jgi:hypothetical protein
MKHAQSAKEALIRMKATAFLTSEKEYWKKRKQLTKDHDKMVDLLNESMSNTPEMLSSIVWAHEDGVSFIRYKSSRPPQVELRVSNTTLQQWTETQLIVPSNKGDISLVQLGFKGPGTLVIRHCKFDDISIDYLDVSHLRYGEDLSSLSIETAILDFQLSLIGSYFKGNGNIAILHNSEIIEKLASIASVFSKLIGEATVEEELQAFIKSNPFILDPTAQIVPKKKLGEDFITDFVIIVTSQNGPKFVLVELEQSSFNLFTKDLSFTSELSHAVKQTREWDIWLEKHKDYLRDKLPGLESPKYLIVIGKSSTLSEDAKAHLRAHNRSSHNTEIATFDDLLFKLTQLIDNLRKLNSSEPQIFDSLDSTPK